jgi:phosphoenolpyruvate carboxykinase (GTP)
MSRETLQSILNVNKEQWAKEAEGISEFYKKFGNKMPKTLKEELNGLQGRLK